MGILDDLKNNLEKLGDKAKEGLDDVRDKAGDLVDDAKERFGHDTTPPLTESSDVGPDSSSTDAVQPGYVTAEDDETEDSDESSLEAEVDADDDPDAAGGPDDVAVEEESLVTEPATPSDVVAPAAAELDPVELDAEETRADEASVDDAPVSSAPVADEPLAESDVDPYDQPLTETIGDEIAGTQVDRQALDDAVGTDRDGQV